MGKLPSNPTDGELISASIDAPQHFAQLFDRHYVEIHGYVQRRLGSRLANRIATRTFIEAFKSRERYGDRGEDARPWLYGIATALVARHHRRERRRLLAYARRGPSLLTEAPEAARERGAPAATRRDLARGIARLDESRRDALLLSAWARLDVGGVAEALGRERADARRLIAAARHIVAASVPARTDRQRRPSPAGRAG